MFEKLKMLQKQLINKENVLSHARVMVIGVSSYLRLILYGKMVTRFAEHPFGRSRSY